MDNMKRVRIAGKAISVRGNDIDTDRIIPARYLRCVTFDGLGEHVFEDDREQLRRSGQLHPFDHPKFANAEILFVNKNFGCGSSREHAPQAIMRWGKGIKAIVGESFAEIFFGNCVALGIPCVTVSEDVAHEIQSLNEAAPETVFSVDLESLTLAADNGKQWPIQLAEGPRQQFLLGRWDSTAELMETMDLIAKTAERLPYFNHWR
ncbi:MAG: 3-isopropylmalate dehydratase small subunit [Candidatus Sumerlaeaceae bacterium]|jgi:3-isopropylmalate/(R)-2-methylmalate dehydratase small subunit